MRHVRTLNDPDVPSRNDRDRLCRETAERVGHDPTVLLYLHGSYGRGDPSPLSGLDFAVLFTEHT